MSGLVLSLFPGLGLLDMAFEAEGFTVVKGPDPLWGGDIRQFRAPARRFDGVIGGPPCQAFSPLANLSGATLDLIPEFERVATEAGPDWFVMENVRQAPRPVVPGYHVTDRLLNNRHLGEEQNRVRRFSFGSRALRRFHIETEVFEPATWKAAVTAAHGGERRTHFKKGTGGKIQRYTVEEALRLQGLPADFFARYQPATPFTRQGQLKLVANGVPLAMGRAVAAAVKRALEQGAERAAA